MIIFHIVFEGSWVVEVAEQQSILFKFCTSVVVKRACDFPFCKFKFNEWFWRILRRPVKVNKGNLVKCRNGNDVLVRYC